MKILIKISILILIANSAFANKIDSLKTVKDVQIFLGKYVERSWSGNYILDSTISDTSKYGKGKFFKIDLDNNGTTDLLINGRYMLGIIDLGENKYHKAMIDKTLRIERHFMLKNNIYRNKIPLLVIYDETGYGRDKFNHNISIPTSGYDTIVYKFGNFLKYNPKPDHFNIEQIKFSYGGNGWSPAFEISIGADKTARQQNMTAVINDTLYKKLISTINYIKFPLLKDLYPPDAIDIPTHKIKIIYNSGQVKHIEVKALDIPIALASLISQLHWLKEDALWE